MTKAVWGRIAPLFLSACLMERTESTDAPRVTRDAAASSTADRTLSGSGQGDGGSEQGCARDGACRECRSDAACRERPGTPVCDKEHGRCVACNESVDCGDAQHARCEAHRCVSCKEEGDCTRLAETAHCDVASGACVSCVSAEHCPDPTAPKCGDAHVCEPCVEHTDCAYARASDTKALPVCLEGTCVECTASALAACGGTVCDALTHRCAAALPESAGACEACVSDAQCKAGNTCVMTTFSPPPTALDPTPAPVEAGWYCQPVIKLTEACLSTKRPYIGERTSGKTIDGAAFVDIKVCTLRATTCAAINQYGKLAEDKQCGVSVASDAGVSVVADDEKCGDSALEDGYCVEFSTGVFVCSVPCRSDPADCPAFGGVSCASLAHGREGVEAPLCTVK